MADLLKHPITVSLLSLLIGTFLGAFLTRFQNKTTILTWSSRTDRIALAAEDQIFGSVAVTWGGQAVQNLYLVSIAVENPSNPSPVGSVRVNPVSWTSAGLPEARYRAVRSLNQPLAVST